MPTHWVFPQRLILSLASFLARPIQKAHPGLSEQDASELCVFLERLGFIERRKEEGAEDLLAWTTVSFFKERSD